MKDNLYAAFVLAVVSAICLFLIAANVASAEVLIVSTARSNPHEPNTFLAGYRDGIESRPAQSDAESYRMGYAQANRILDRDGVGCAKGHGCDCPANEVCTCGIGRFCECGPGCTCPADRRCLCGTGGRIKGECVAQASATRRETPQPAAPKRLTGDPRIDGGAWVTICNKDTNTCRREWVPLADLPELAKGPVMKVQEPAPCVACPPAATSKGYTRQTKAQTGWYLGKRLGR